MVAGDIFEKGPTETEKVIEKVAEILNWYAHACPYIDWHVPGNEDIKNYRREHARDILSTPVGTKTIEQLIADIPASLSSFIYAEAWRTLYSCFGERMQQDELNLMDSVLQGVKLEMQDDMERFEMADILKRFPHLSAHLGIKEKEE